METWTTRDLPVLRAIVDHFEQPPPVVPVAPERLAAVTGLTVPEVEAALGALSGADQPYITGIRGMGVYYPVRITGVTERARRAVGQWPASDDAADQFLAVLRAAAEAEPDPEKRSRLRRIVGFFGEPGKEILAKVIAEFAAKYVPH